MSGGSTVPSSMMQQSWTFDRGSNMQSDPMRTDDPMERECMRVFCPIRVCEPMVIGRDFSLMPGGVFVAASTPDLSTVANNGSLDFGMTDGMMTTPRSI